MSSICTISEKIRLWQGVKALFHIYVLRLYSKCGPKALMCFDTSKRAICLLYVFQSANIGASCFTSKVNSRQLVSKKSTFSALSALMVGGARDRAETRLGEMSQAFLSYPDWGNFIFSSTVFNLTCHIVPCSSLQKRTRKTKMIILRYGIKSVEACNSSVAYVPSKVDHDQLYW